MLRLRLSALLLLFIAVSCSNDKKQILGKWESGELGKPGIERVEFFQDGTVGITVLQGSRRSRLTADYKFIDKQHIRIVEKNGDVVYEYRLPSKSALNLINAEGREIQLSKVNSFSDLPPTEEEIKTAMIDLRVLTTATEAYAVDNNVYPVVGDGLASGLAKVLEPEYLKPGRTPLKDPWGNIYVYIPSADRQDHCMISPGPDHQKDRQGYDADGMCVLNGAGIATSMKAGDDDIVMTQGTFVKYPSGFRDQ